jgi:hypothetical protein
VQPPRSLKRPVGAGSPRASHPCRPTRQRPPISPYRRCALTPTSSHADPSAQIAAVQPGGGLSAVTLCQAWIACRQLQISCSFAHLRPPRVRFPHTPWSPGGLYRHLDHPGAATLAESFMSALNLLVHHSPRDLIVIEIQSTADPALRSACRRLRPGGIGTGAAHARQREHGGPPAGSRGRSRRRGASTLIALLRSRHPAPKATARIEGRRRSSRPIS